MLLLPLRSLVVSQPMQKVRHDQCSFFANLHGAALALRILSWVLLQFAFAADETGHAVFALADVGVEEERLLAVAG